MKLFSFLCSGCNWVWENIYLALFRLFLFYLVIRRETSCKSLLIVQYQLSISAIIQESAVFPKGPCEVQFRQDRQQDGRKETHVTLSAYGGALLGTSELGLPAWTLVWVKSSTPPPQVSYSEESSGHNQEGVRGATGWRLPQTVDNVCTLPTTISWEQSYFKP